MGIEYHAVPAWVYGNPLTNPDPNVAATQDRLLRMETALLRVVQHLENQSQASQPEMEEAFS